MNGSAAVCLVSVMKVHVGRADSLLKLKFLEQLEPRVYRATKKKEFGTYTCGASENKHLK